MVAEAGNATAGPRRSPSLGGYARGDEARQRLVLAALEEFRTHGYPRALTREIAARAGMTPPALQYYFSSKAGLYRACIDLIISAIFTRLGPLLREGDLLLASHADANDLIEFYCRLQDSLIDSFLEPYEGEVIGRLLFWETMAKGMEKGQIDMRDRIELPIMRIFSGIIGRLLRKPATDIEAEVHTFAATGIFRIFHTDDRRTLSLFGWRATDIGKKELIKTVLRQQSTALLQHLGAVGEARRIRTGRAHPPENLMLFRS